MVQENLVEYLVVDTIAFIQNAPLQNISNNIVTCPEVVDEIKNKRQLRRLVVLPYNLVVKDVDPENVHIITEFAKKTGDYPSLSATDIKVMALTYQLHKEHVGTEGLRTEPVMQKAVVTTKNETANINPDVTGFFIPGKTTASTDGAVENDEKTECEDQEDENEVQWSVTIDRVDQVEIAESEEENESEEKLVDQANAVENTVNHVDTTDDLKDEGTPNIDDVLVSVTENEEEYSTSEDTEDDDDEDGGGWITPSNVKKAKMQVNSLFLEEQHAVVACMTTDFAMQNVLKQMNLNVSALDGRLIKHLRTYILRCYACFKTTSVMTKRFCPKCGNDTLKKVAVSLGEDGKLVIHINSKRPLSGRGKKFSLPKIKGGKHPNNPVLVEDQPMPDNKPSRLARMKNNPLDDDYIAGYSPFVMRDINSKSAQLGIRPGQEFKYWMKKNPNEANRRRRK